GTGLGPVKAGQAQPAQSKYPPKPPPPARSSMPRRPAPRAPFDFDAGDIGPALGVPPAGAPAGAPPAARGAGGAAAAHAFDGLALPVRETDVFSGLPLGADDPVLGGSGSGPLRKPAKRARGGEGTGRTPRPGDIAEALAPLEPLPPLPPVC